MQHWQSLFRGVKKVDHADDEDPKSNGVIQIKVRATADVFSNQLCVTRVKRAVMSNNIPELQKSLKSMTDSTKQRLLQGHLNRHDLDIIPDLGNVANKGVMNIKHYVSQVWTLAVLYGSEQTVVELLASGIEPLAEEADKNNVLHILVYMAYYNPQQEEILMER